MSHILRVAAAAAVLLSASFASAQQGEPDYDKQLSELKSKYDKQVEMFEALVKTMRRQMNEDFRMVGEILRKARSGEKVPGQLTIPADDVLSVIATDLREDVEHGRDSVNRWVKRAENRLEGQKKAWEDYLAYMRAENKDGLKAPAFPAQDAAVTLFRDISDDIEHINGDIRRVVERTSSRVAQERREWTSFREQVRKEFRRISERSRKDFEELLNSVNKPEKTEKK